jgi:hypothetical protein
LNDSYKPTDPKCLTDHTHENHEGNKSRTLSRGTKTSVTADFSLEAVVAGRQWSHVCQYREKKKEKPPTWDFPHRKGRKPFQNEG